MDFGIWDPFNAVPKPGGPPELTSSVYEHHFRQAAEAEQLGFSHYYVIEHQSNHNGISSPTVLLAALSQRTSTIRLGSMIWQLPFHNPLRLAQDVAMLDQLSRGRVEFGSGLGVHEHEYLRWGLDFESRREVAEEALEVIKAAWTQEELTHDGVHFRYDEAFPAPRPYQIPHPPIWVAAHSKQAIEFAARHKLGIAQNIDTDEIISAKYAYFRETFNGLYEGESLPRTWLMRGVIVDETDEKAYATAEQYLSKMFDSKLGFLKSTRLGIGTGKYLTGPVDTPDNAARREVFAGVRKSFEYALKNGLAIVGSPETVARRIREQCSIMGGINVYCAEFDLNLPTPIVERSMNLFGRHVIPALR